MPCSRPPVRRLTREPASNVTPEAMRTADQVRRILAKALRLLEEGRLFESEVAAGGEGPGGQLALEGVRKPAGSPLPKASVTATTPGPPRTPSRASRARARPAARGRRDDAGPRRWSCGSSTRACGAPLVEEDGIRRVVINSAYPLYEVRRGDLWYQLETALREVCVRRSPRRPSRSSSGRSTS